jgi:hypothetical protein
MTSRSGPAITGIGGLVKPQSGACRFPALWSLNVSHHGIAFGLTFVYRRFLMAIFALLSGYKTYLGAVGFVGLAVYQISQGQIDTSIQSFLAALTTAGLRHAVAKLPG